MMYILHSNPYDAMLGTNDVNAMQDYVQYCYEKKQSFIMMSLYMRDFDEEGKEFPSEMKADIRQFVYRLASNARLFKVGRGHMILLFPKKNNPNYE